LDIECANDSKFVTQETLERYRLEITKRDRKTNEWICAQTVRSYNENCEEDEVDIDWSHS